MAGQANRHVGRVFNSIYSRRFADRARGDSVDGWARAISGEFALQRASGRADLHPTIHRRRVRPRPSVGRPRLLRANNIRLCRPLSRPPSIPSHSHLRPSVRDSEVGSVRVAVLNILHQTTDHS